MKQFLLRCFRPIWQKLTLLIIALFVTAVHLLIFPSPTLTYIAAVPANAGLGIRPRQAQCRVPHRRQAPKRHKPITEVALMKIASVPLRGTRLLDPAEGEPNDRISTRRRFICAGCFSDG